MEYNIIHLTRIETSSYKLKWKEKQISLSNMIKMMEKNNGSFFSIFGDTLKKEKNPCIHNLFLLSDSFIIHLNRRGNRVSEERIVRRIEYAHAILTSYHYLIKYWGIYDITDNVLKLSSAVKIGKEEREKLIDRLSYQLIA